MEECKFAGYDCKNPVTTRRGDVMDFCEQHVQAFDALILRGPKMLPKGEQTEKCSEGTCNNYAIVDAQTGEFIGDRPLCWTHTPQ